MLRIEQVLVCLPDDVLHFGLIFAVWVQVAVVVDQGGHSQVSLASHYASQAQKRAGFLQKLQAGAGDH